MVQYRVITAEFRRGQDAAWQDYYKDEDSVPNRELLARLQSEDFAAGYLDEYENFIVPVKNGAPRGTR